MVYFGLASAACSITVKIIKRVVRQARPSPTLVISRGRVKKSYGWVVQRSGTLIMFSLMLNLCEPAQNAQHTCCCSELPSRLCPPRMPSSPHTPQLSPKHRFSSPATTRRRPMGNRNSSIQGSTRLPYMGPGDCWYPIRCLRCCRNVFAVEERLEGLVR